MSRAFRIISLTLAAALLVAVALACKGEGGDGSDDTNREITEDELAQMVLALEDFGGAYTGFLVDEENGVQTSEMKADGDFDPADEAKDLKEYGYASGYGADFLSPDAESTGVFAVGSEVDLYEDVDGAIGYFEDTKTEIEDSVGSSNEEMDVTAVEPFSVDVGDEAAGYVLKGGIDDDEGSSVDVWLMVAGFRHGRLVGSVYLGSLEERDSRDGLRGWARVMDQRMSTVLAGAAVSDDDSGDDGGDDGSTTSTGGDDPVDLVSADPQAVLSETARSFQEDVTSLEMEMEMTFGTEGVTFDATAEMAFQAPDQMYATVDMGVLGSFEMLLDGTDMYMNMPGEGWVVFSFEDLLGGLSLDGLGLDEESLQEQWDEHSLIDLQEMFGGLGGTIEDLGDEEIDGKTYRHYRGTIDVGAAMSTLGETGGFSTEDLGLGDVSGPMTFDYWFDPETFFPHRMTIGGEVSVDDETFTMDMTMVLTSYNQPVSIPEPPADATSFAELFGETFY